MFGKSEVERELYHCQSKIELLEQQLQEVLKDKIALQRQIDKLQEALFSVHAPEAYREMKADEYDSKRVKPTQEEIERVRVENEVLTRYVNGMEGPLFTSGDDLDALLSSGLLKDMKPAASLHGNDES